jgi:O-antigen ligase
MRTARPICQYSVCALPLLLGLVYIPSLDAPFSAPKTALLIVAGVALFASAAAAGWLSSLRRRSAESRDLSIMLALCAGYCFAVLASWMASPRLDMGGHAVLFALAGPLLFAAAAAVMGGAQRWLVRCIALAGGLQTVIALAQWGLALDVFSPFGASAPVRGRMQIYGTLGNPDFVAVFIAACMPALVTLTCDGRSRILRWLGGAAVAAEFVAIFATGCRTGLFSAAIGVAATLVLHGTPSRRELNRRIGIAAVFMLAIGIGTVIFVRRSPLGAQEAVRGRLFVWQTSLSKGSWHTLLGSGPGTFAYGYPARVAFGPLHSRIPGLSRFIGYERTAVNDFLQALVETGWLGLLTLTGTIAWWLHIVWRHIKRSDSKHPSSTTVAAFAGVIVLLVAAFFESPLQHEDWALLWLWMALPLAGFQVSDDALPASIRISTPVWVTRWAIAAAVTLGAAYLAVQPAIASYWTAVGVRSEDRQHYSLAIDAYQRALAHDATSPDAHFNLARSLAMSGDLEGGLRASDDALRWVDEPELYLMRAYMRENQDDYPGAVRELAAGLRLFPFSLKLQMALADAGKHLSGAKSQGAR